MIRTTNQKTRLRVLSDASILIFNTAGELLTTIPAIPPAIFLDAIFLSDASVLTLSDDKVVRHYSPQGQLLHHVVLAKKPSAAIELPDRSVLVADRFGDVFRLMIDELPGADADPSGLKETLPERIIIAHFSYVTALGVSPDGKAVVTALRDEKLCVTRYPRVDIIQAFCYGFYSVVTSVRLVTLAGKIIVVAAGADGKIIVFDMLTGEVIGMTILGPEKVVVLCDCATDETTLSVLFVVEDCGLSETKASFQNEKLIFSPPTPHQDVCWAHYLADGMCTLTTTSLHLPSHAPINLPAPLPTVAFRFSALRKTVQSDTTPNDVSKSAKHAN